MLWKRLMAATAAALASLGLVFALASPAQANPYTDNNCRVTVTIDRQDGTTNTYAFATMKCDHDVHTSTDVDVRLYKSGGLRARDITSCGTPVHNYCGGSSGMTSGSRGTWTAEAYVTTQIANVQYNFKDSDTTSRTF